MFPIARNWLRRRSTHFLLAASAIGWAGVILVPNHIQAGETCFAYSSISGLRGAPSWDSLLFSNSAAGLLFGWLWMVLAMAPPLLGTQVEHVWHGTLSRNRFLALTLFFAGYTTASLPAGFVLNAVALILLSLAGGSFLIAISFATLLVGIFELTAAKRRALASCHRMRPLAVFGGKFAAGTVAFGARSALACSASCWGFMLLAILAGNWHAAAMALITMVALFERLRPLQAGDRSAGALNALINAIASQLSKVARRPPSRVSLEQGP